MEVRSLPDGCVSTNARTHERRQSIEYIAATNAISTHGMVVGFSSASSPARVMFSIALAKAVKQITERGLALVVSNVQDRGGTATYSKDSVSCDYPLGA